VELRRLVMEILGRGLVVVDAALFRSTHDDQVNKGETDVNLCLCCENFVSESFFQPDYKTLQLQLIPDPTTAYSVR
jgi:hypothetical protein